MRVAIVGFPYSGKSTLFSAISGLSAEQMKPAEENLAAVKIPDSRLDWLEALFKPRKRTEASIDFVDLPGSTEGETQRAGLTKHLPTLRQCDGLLLLVRAFESESVPLHNDRLDPQADYAELRDELLLADMFSCDTRIERLEKSIGKPTRDRENQKAELALLQRCREALENEKPLRDVVQPGEEEKMLRSFGFLTQKPILLAVNVGENQLASPPTINAPEAAVTFAVSAEIEAEIMQVAPEDRQEFMDGYGITELARDRIINASFNATGMIVFLTGGEDEVRAWPIVKGTPANEAAGKIHSDLQRGFIRAETVAFEDLKEAGSMRDAKAAGKVRLEPKTYIVQDGDILNIKFNV